MHGHNTGNAIDKEEKRWSRRGCPPARRLLLIGSGKVAVDAQRCVNDVLELFVDH
jgi:hypothetical protein